MAALNLLMRFMLALLLVSQLASMIKCSNGKDPDDYDDLDEDENYIIEESDLHPTKAPGELPEAGVKLDQTEYHALMRPRLGHFERYPELRLLYEDYFEKFLKLRDSTMKKVNKGTDWRALRPPPDFCIAFLSLFKSKRYIMNKPLDLIPLDACLEWVFLDEVTVDETHPDHDRQVRAVGERELDLRQTSSHMRSETELLASDDTLRSIYENTLFATADEVRFVDGKREVRGDGVPRRMRLKLKKYLLRLLEIHEQDPSKGCHSLWLDAYTSFMEQVYKDCYDDKNCVHFGDQRLDEDRYFRLVAVSTIQSSKACYETMQSSILTLMHESYDGKASLVSLSRMLPLGKGKLERQYEEQKWSRDMVKILQLVSGQETNKPISLSDVVDHLWQIKSGNEDDWKDLLVALGKYALVNTDVRATGDDFQGVKRYARAITRLCKAYMDEKLFLVKAGALDLDEEEIKNKEPFLFYHIIYSLIRLTDHESIYGITKDQFEEDVLHNKWEALYLTTFACQVISSTHGELSTHANKDTFEVFFQPEFLTYVDNWPLKVMDHRLTKEVGKPDESLKIEPKRIKGGESLENDEDEDKDGEEKGVAPVSPSRNYDMDGEKKRPNSNYKGKVASSYGDAFRKKMNKFFKLSGGTGGGSSGTGSSTDAQRKGYIMSEEEIRQYHKSFGKWPELPDNIRKIYPKLPATCVQKKPQQQTAGPVGLQIVPTITQQQEQEQPQQQSPVTQAAFQHQAPPVYTRTGNQETPGYWASGWSREDDLPSWNVPRTPPRQESEFQPERRNRNRSY